VDVFLSATPVSSDWLETTRNCWLKGARRELLTNLWCWWCPERQPVSVRLRFQDTEARPSYRSDLPLGDRPTQEARPGEYAPPGPWPFFRRFARQAWSRSSWIPRCGVSARPGCRCSVRRWQRIDAGLLYCQAEARSLFRACGGGIRHFGGQPPADPLMPEAGPNLCRQRLQT